MFPSEVAKNLPFAIRILSSIYITLNLIGCVLVSEPTEEETQNAQKTFM